VADGFGFLEEFVDLTAIHVAQEEDPAHEVVASFFEVFALTAGSSQLRRFLLDFDEISLRTAVGIFSCSSYQSKRRCALGGIKGFNEASR
jgi:hypothetical protein